MTDVREINGKLGRVYDDGLALRGVTLHNIRYVPEPSTSFSSRPQRVHLKTSQLR